MLTTELMLFKYKIFLHLSVIIELIYCACRIRIMQNIGIAFVKLGQYNDAITSFEHIMVEEPAFVTGFNLILCYFAMGER